MRFEEIVKNVQEMPAVRHMIPLNVQMGFPVLKQWKDEILVLFPYYTVKVIDGDIWMSFPLFYVEISYPNGRLRGIQNCRYSSLFPEYDYDSYAGIFTKGKGESIEIYQEQIREYTANVSSLLDQCRQHEKILDASISKSHRKLMEIAELFHQPFYKKWIEM